MASRSVAHLTAVVVDDDDHRPAPDFAAAGHGPAAVADPDDADHHDVDRPTDADDTDDDHVAPPPQLLPPLPIQTMPTTTTPTGPPTPTTPTTQYVTTATAHDLQ